MHARRRKGDPGAVKRAPGGRVLAEVQAHRSPAMWFPARRSALPPQSYGCRISQSGSFALRKCTSPESADRSSVKNLVTKRLLQAFGHRNAQHISTSSECTRDGECQRPGHEWLPQFKLGSFVHWVPAANDKGSPRSRKQEAVLPVFLHPVDSFLLVDLLFAFTALYSQQCSLG